MPSNGNGQSRTKAHSLGVACDACGSCFSRVVGSRPHKGMTTRKRKCLGCGQTFLTYEVGVDMLADNVEIEAFNGGLFKKIYEGKVT